MFLTLVVVLFCCCSVCFVRRILVLVCLAVCYALSAWPLRSSHSLEIVGLFSKMQSYANQALASCGVWQGVRVEVKFRYGTLTASR